MHANVPRGIEVLVKKASVDPDFKALLLRDPLAAAASIGLDLSGTEQAMVLAMDSAQLERIVGNTRVPASQRAAFLGKVAGVMLLALGTTLLGGCPAPTPAPTGIRPDDERKMEKKAEDQKKKDEAGKKDEKAEKEEKPATPAAGEKEPPADEPKTRGIRPDRPPRDIKEKK